MLIGLIFGLSLFELVLTVVIVAIAAYWLIPKLAVSRTTDSIRAQVGKVGRLVASQDPVAMAQQSIDDASQEIKQARISYEENGALARGIARQIDDNKRQINVLDNRIKQTVAKGDDDRAKDLIVQKQQRERELAANQDQYNKTKEMYVAIGKRLEQAQNRIARAEANAVSLKAQLNMSRVIAETSELSQKFNGKFNSLDKLGEAESIIKEQIDLNLAKSDAVHDLGLDQLDNLEEDEDLANAEAELEKYKRGQTSI